MTMRRCRRGVTRERPAASSDVDVPAQATSIALRDIILGEMEPFPGLSSAEAAPLRRAAAAVTAARSAATWSEEGCYPGEGVFAGRPGRTAEDDGVVLSVVLDAPRGTSFLLVLDAATFTEVSLIVATSRRSSSTVALMASAIAPVTSSVTLALTVRSPSPRVTISSSRR